MNHEQGIEPLGGQDTAKLVPLPENPTPQDYGLPENPRLDQQRAWLKQDQFLAEFASCGIVSQASKDAGVTVANVEWWDSQDVYGFKKRKAAAGQVALGRLEEEINRRIFEGVEKPVIYKGEITATYKDFPENPLFFRVKKLDPTYRDNFVVNVDTKDVKVTSIVYNLHPNVRPPVPESVMDAEVRELPTAEDEEGNK